MALVLVLVLALALALAPLRPVTAQAHTRRQPKMSFRIPAIAG